MRRLTKPGRPAAPLAEDMTLLLLLGLDAPLAPMRRLMFTVDLRRVAALWCEHEAFLLREATRRQIARPHDPDLGRAAFFGEYAVAMMRKFPERYGDDRTANSLSISRRSTNRRSNDHA